MYKKTFNVIITRVINELSLSFYIRSATIHVSLCLFKLD